MTSDETDEYNCAAWAAGDDTNWWWPHPDCYWPPGARRDNSLEALAEGYATLGYIDCADGAFEAGFEKIAFYAAPDGVPTHVAKQLPNGRWTSKLGGWEDIEHLSERDLEGIGLYRYGTAQRFMRRSRAT